MRKLWEKKKEATIGMADSIRYEWPTLRLGDPCTSGPLTVFPVLATNGGYGDYVLLADAVKSGVAKVKELNKRGNIPVIQIDNGGKLPVLGIQGEEYVGAKQNRTLNISVLAGPGKTRIPVTCVEQGRWDMGPTCFAAGAYESMNMRSMKMGALNKSSKTVKDKLKKFFADQGMVWGAVQEASYLHGVNSRTMALNDIYSSDKVSKSLDEIMGGIELPHETRGAAIGISGRIVACDLFEDSTVFNRIWPRILRSYALSSLGTEGVPPSLEAAETFVTKPQAGAWNVTNSVGLGADVRWEGKDFLANTLVWRERFLHAMIFSRDEV